MTLPKPYTPADFLTFLHSIDPNATYTIVPLTGGLINVTVRAIRTSSSSNLFSLHQTLILKYAPPYIASIGPDAPFSAYRQTIEARALRFLTSTPEIRDAQKRSRVMVPELVYHDEESHILVMTDLGDDLTTVDVWLRGCPSVAESELVGRQLGAFLGALHALRVPDAILREFENEEVKGVIKSEVVDRMQELLCRFDVSAEEKDHIVEMMVRELEDVQEGSRVFSVGDFWVGSVIVSPGGEKVGIVDWEFAGARKPLQDMAQFGGSFNVPQADKKALAFITALYTEHRQESYRLHAPWLSDEKLIRSTWILHGREVVYNAGKDAQEQIPPSPQEEERWKEMAEVGLWYLRAAMKGITEDNIETEVFLKPLYRESA